jgi:hypothetical protein
MKPMTDDLLAQAEELDKLAEDVKQEQSSFKDETFDKLAQQRSETDKKLSAPLETLRRVAERAA